MQTSTSWSTKRRLLNVLAVATATATFILLFSGGLVTSYKVGMAVPDWPTTFNENMFTYYFLNAEFGTQVEHSHRLIASGIGALTILLGVAIGCWERRVWVLGLGAGGIVLVITQGVLGGQRVLLNEYLGTHLATIHGCVAQAFFALTITLAVVTSRWWVEARATQHPDARTLRRFTVGTALVVYLQIVLGATVRHFGSGPMFFLHFGLAGMLLLGVVWIGLMVLNDADLRKRLGVVTIALLFAVGIQILLGMGAMALTGLLSPTQRTEITTQEALTTTTHLIFGSVVFALCVVLALRSIRFLQPMEVPLESAKQSERVLETVA